MASPYIIPFNHQPVSSAAISGGSYTCPAGKYARVVLTLSASARGTCNTLSVISNSTTSGLSSTQEFWLRAGQTITTSTTIASGSATPSSNTSSLLLSSDSIASATIGGVQVAKIMAPATIQVTSAVASTTLTMTGAASADFYYEEYNVIS
jgi:hypothetical protein